MIVMSQVTAIAKDLSQWGYVVQFLFLINDQLSPWSVTHRPPGLAQSSSVGHVRWRDLYLTINYARCIGINTILNSINSGRMK